MLHSCLQRHVCPKAPLRVESTRASRTFLIKTRAFSAATRQISLALCVFVVVLIVVEGAARQFQPHHDGRRSILGKRANLKGLRKVPMVGFSPVRFSLATHDDF